MKKKNASSFDYKSRIIENQKKQIRQLKEIVDKLEIDNKDKVPTQNKDERKEEFYGRKTKNWDYSEFLSTNMKNFIRKRRWRRGNPCFMRA